VPFLYSTNGELCGSTIAARVNRSRALPVSTLRRSPEMLARDLDSACGWFAATRTSIPCCALSDRGEAAIEQTIAGRKLQMLVAMATVPARRHTGQPGLPVMKSAWAANSLLVDRRALAAQAVNAFASFEPEPGLKFDKIYESTASGSAGGPGDEEKFDPKVLPREYLVNPAAGHAFVYICTIQRMAINLFGGRRRSRLRRRASPNEMPQVPIHPRFDLIVRPTNATAATPRPSCRCGGTLDTSTPFKVADATPAAHIQAYFSEWSTATSTSECPEVLRFDARLRPVERPHGRRVLQEAQRSATRKAGSEQLDACEDDHFDTTDIEPKSPPPTRPQDHRGDQEVALGHEQRTAGSRRP